MKGAIFDRTVPWFSYDRSDQAVTEVAGHIFVALHAPTLTYPRKFDKDIPGNIWNGEWKPLHRNYPKFDAASEDVTKRNKAANDRACAGLTHDPGEQCDEFPFASTKEGAGKGDGSFSVRYVRQTDNSTAGARLSIWYGKDRILDGDAYGMLVR
ncbi:NucA/NucB deoxyribonuclease domain-containing protein [Streptomyces sp. NBC_00648]|uniref:NucA/NucB deoxyribonuclease domain-containing protein n=1 Tax=Streptomyces sp. NBC_00648 TaxID=2975797 RepID=UPI0032511B05